MSTMPRQLYQLQSGRIILCIGVKLQTRRAKLRADEAEFKLNVPTPEPCEAWALQTLRAVAAPAVLRKTPLSLYRRIQPTLICGLESPDFNIFYFISILHDSRTSLAQTYLKQLAWCVTITWYLTSLELYLRISDTVATRNLSLTFSSVARCCAKQGHIDCKLTTLICTDWRCWAW